MNNRIKVAAVLLLMFATRCWAAQQFSATGLIVKVDPPRQTMVVSCQNIPGYMDAMVMPIPVPDVNVLKKLSPGLLVDFTLVVEKDSSYAKDIRIRKFESAEQDPFTAHQLKDLQAMMAPSQRGAPPLAIGDAVPDFSLIDQAGKPVTLAQFAGKVVAMNFIYTRCALPQFCYRLSNNFAQLQKRFSDRLGRDFVLLTVSFDPVHDRPETLAVAARQWKADVRTWHFLTGSTTDVQQVCDRFGVSAWTDEGLMIHSLHTVIINGRGRLAANLEGNQFTARQLGDLLESVMNSRP